MPGKALVFLCIALLLTGCRKSEPERNEIIRVLGIRSTALNMRDITVYMSVISASYNDKGKNRSLLKESLEKNFRDFEQLSYEAENPAITFSGTTSEAVSNYRMKIRIRGKEMSLNGTEHLKLIKEPEGWKIIAGI